MAAFRIALAIWAFVTVVALFAQPVGMIGDAGEYALMLMPWVRHYTPEIRQDDILAFNRLLETQPLRDAAPAWPIPDPFIQVPNSNPPTWDQRHFWFYSLLARPFLPLTRLPAQAWTAHTSRGCSLLAWPGSATARPPRGTRTGS